MEQAWTWLGSDSKKSDLLLYQRGRSRPRLRVEVDLVRGATRPMVRVLGPIDVLTGDVECSVGGHQPRALLGALVVGAGHAVPTDHLQWVLWGDAPPASADVTLQSYVSHLRHLLGPEGITSADHSYELSTNAVDIDAIEFERLVRQADADRQHPDRCWQRCREALSLWRGVPFGGLADDEAFVIEVRRLDELRLAVMEFGLEAELALGRHDLVVGELEAAVAEHPYREHLWILLIKALAQGDRRVEALRACRDLRHTLGELGLGAVAELAEIEQGIHDGTRF